MRTPRSLRAACVAAALVASVFPMRSAFAAPTIELLNPSGYTATPQLSGKADVNGAYHLVAWVSDVPANPLVEFEIIGVQTPTSTATVTATQASSDTFEGDFAIPSAFSDGQYILRAIIYENFTGPGTGTERDTAEQVVTINNSDVIPPPQAETLEITYPENGGEFGFYTPPGKATAGVIAGTASANARQVRVLYTTTSAGSAPAWKDCGSGPVATDRSFRARCTLETGTSLSSVRAVAAVANETAPPVPPNAAADEAGDAHRVVPFAQEPTTVSFEPSAIQQEPARCQALVVQVADQDGQPIAVANVDVHAVGPTDQLRFATQAGTNSGFQSPDKGHGGTETTARCAATDSEGTQAEHSVPGGNDLKHIESTTGTNNAGEFTFVLRSDDMGGTQVNAWADDVDDDSRGLGEASGNGRIGWGQAPPPPQQEIFVDPTSATATVGTCHRFVVAARQSGAPIVGANADIHIIGPAGVAFCSTGDSNTRAPDLGGHTGDAHDADTRHNEGETDDAGNLVFGVTAPTEGDTQIVAWLDSPDDDALTASEPTGTSRVEWQQVGERSISIEASSGSVRKGRRVRFTGTINAAESCARNQEVELKARRPGSPFKTIKRGRSNDEGDYSFRVTVRKTKDYRTVAPQSGVCDKAKSPKKRVRAR